MGMCEDCSRCDGFCAMRTTAYEGMKGMGIVPALPAALQVGGSILSSLINIFGAPRGDLQKFERTAYPRMLQQAQTTGYNVYMGWFGDEVVVMPNGQKGIAVPDRGQSWAEKDAEIARIEAGRPYFLTRSNDPDPVNHPESLTFELQNPPGVGGQITQGISNLFSSITGSAPGVSQAGLGGNSLLLIGIGAAILFFASKSFGRPLRRRR